MRQANLDWVMKADNGFDNPHQFTPAATYSGDVFLYLTFSRVIFIPKRLN